MPPEDQERDPRDSGPEADNASEIGANDDNDAAERKLDQEPRTIGEADSG